MLFKYIKCGYHLFAFSILDYINCLLIFDGYIANVLAIIIYYWCAMQSYYISLNYIIEYRFKNFDYIFNEPERERSLRKTSAEN